MRLIRPALSVLMAVAFATPLGAQERVVIYRCAGADGAVIVQNDRPCPTGTVQQDRRVIRAPDAPAAASTNRPGLIETAPGAGVAPAAGTPGGVPATPSPGIAPVPAPPGVNPAAPSAGIVPAPGGVAPAPAAVPPAALATVPGVVPTEGGAPPPLYSCRTPGGPVYFSENPSPPPRCATLATTGLGPAPAAGSACEVVRDDCAPVPAAALCASWRARLNALETAMTFGRLDERATASVELDRVRGIVGESACGE